MLSSQCREMFISLILQKDRIENKSTRRHNAQCNRSTTTGAFRSGDRESRYAYGTRAIVDSTVKNPDAVVLLYYILVGVSDPNLISIALSVVRELIELNPLNIACLEQGEVVNSVLRLVSTLVTNGTVNGQPLIKGIHLFYQ